jgi:hypothetical protein
MAVNTSEQTTSELPVAWPSEAQLRRDIRHFERQIARLSSPTSPWEQGALKCYQVLVKQRRKILDAIRSGDMSNAQEC